MLARQRVVDIGRQRRSVRIRQRVVATTTSVTHQNVLWQKKTNSGFHYDPAIDYAKAAYLGPMDHICAHCKAFKFKFEPKGLCCLDGKVKLPNISPPPPYVQKLVGVGAEDTDSECKHFLDNICEYNTAFQMTSIGANVQRSLKKSIVKELQRLLHSNNQCVIDFKKAVSVLGQNHKSNCVINDY